MNTPQPTQTIVTNSPKNMGIAIILTFLFGPLGLFYASVWGGIVTILLGIILGLITFGLALFIIWPITIVWAIVSVSMHNGKLKKQATQPMTAQPVAQATVTPVPPTQQGDEEEQKTLSH